MKTLILAGGFGSRLSEETNLVPKPMVKVGDLPIIEHIMKIYSSFGFNDFVILAGYKSEIIKDYFINYYKLNSDIAIDLATNNLEILKHKTQNWKITIVDSGLNAMTGGRLLSARHLIDDDFMLTYGDGVANVDIHALIAAHKKANTIATLTAVKPYGRFGALQIDDNNQISAFMEKQDNHNYINGGFFVFKKEIFDYLENEKTILEQEPLQKLAFENQLHAYKHSGFWHAMDTLKDKTDLTAMYESGKAPWRCWE